jgi:molecular chaperone GrpE (heat shock protein)
LGDPRLEGGGHDGRSPVLAGVRSAVEEHLREIRRLRGERLDLESKLAGQRKKVLLDLIRVADALDNHLDHASRRQDELNERGRRLLAGIQTARKQLGDVLRKHGVSPLDCTGVANPDLCTIVDTEPRDDVPEGTILEVVVRGYLLDGDILRSPEVKVASAP